MSKRTNLTKQLAEIPNKIALNHNSYYGWSPSSFARNIANETIQAVIDAGWQPKKIKPRTRTVSPFSYEDLKRLEECTKREIDLEKDT